MWTIKELKESLNYLCTFLDNVYNINSGGCCLLAYLIASHLDKLGIKYSLIIHSYDKKCKAKIVKEILNKNLEIDSINSVTGKNTCWHYTLKLFRNGIINDNYEEIYPFNYQIQGICSDHIKWIYESGKWNKIYNIKYSNSIKDIIDTFFKQYNKN